MQYHNRVGLEQAKKAVVENAESRKARYERLLYSLQGYEDPWQAAVKKPEVRREFEALEI